MRKEVLISIGDSRMKEVAEVLGSDSCLRILDLLAVEDLAVSDIARKLSMKLNTVDYNVKKLVMAGLIEKSGHWWSVKGKKMPVYQVVDRKIVISPRRSVPAKFLWVLGLTGIVGVWIRSLVKPVDVIMKDVVFEAAPQMDMLAANAGMTESVARSVGSVSFWSGLAGWEWFLIGAWFAIVLFFIFSLISERGLNK
ncbi:MAG: helix-turn-helix domain-containing protein [archaeon]